MVVVGALRSVSKKLAGHLEQLGIKNRTRTMQKSALLGSAHILRKVLEVWGLGMRLDWIFLPRENPCAKFYIIIIVIPSWSQRLDKTPWRLSIIPFNFPASKKSRNIEDSKFEMWARDIVTEAFNKEYLGPTFQCNPFCLLARFKFSCEGTDLHFKAIVFVSRIS